MHVQVSPLNYNTTFQVLSFTTTKINVRNGKISVIYVATKGNII